MISPRVFTKSTQRDSGFPCGSTHRALWARGHWAMQSRSRGTEQGGQGMLSDREELACPQVSLRARLHMRPETTPRPPRTSVPNDMTCKVPAKIKVLREQLRAARTRTFACLCLGKLGELLCARSVPSFDACATRPTSTCRVLWQVPDYRGQCQPAPASHTARRCTCHP